MTTTWEEGRGWREGLTRRAGRTRIGRRALAAGDLIRENPKTLTEVRTVLDPRETAQVSSIHRWCFEPSQPLKIMTSGLKTNFNLSQSYSFHMSVYHKSLCFLNHNSDHILNFGTQTHKNNKTCFRDYLYSSGTAYRNLHQSSITMSRVTELILRAHTGTGVSHS